MYLIESEPNIPRSILALPGMTQLLLGSTGAGNEYGLSEGAAAAIATVQAYQAQSSDVHLAKPGINPRGSDGGGLNQFKNLNKNLSKAHQVIAERKSKREEVIAMGGIANGIKVSTTLWSLANDRSKMSQVIFEF